MRASEARLGHRGSRAGALHLPPVRERAQRVPTTDDSTHPRHDHKPCGVPTDSPSVSERRMTRLGRLGSRCSATDLASRSDRFACQRSRDTPLFTQPARAGIGLGRQAIGCARRPAATLNVHTPARARPAATSAKRIDACAFHTRAMPRQAAPQRSAHGCTTLNSLSVPKPRAAPHVIGRAHNLAP